MKVSIITLWQPWAYLMAIGAKKIETRSKNTKHRGLLLIHAAKDFKHAHYFLGNPYFEKFLPDLRMVNEIGYGKIIGAVNVFEVLPSYQVRYYADNFARSRYTLHGVDVQDWKQELAFGDYSPGRYAWLTKDHCHFKNPVEWKGAQGIRGIVPPFEVIAQLSDNLKLLL